MNAFTLATTGMDAPILSSASQPRLCWRDPVWHEAVLARRCLFGRREWVGLSALRTSFAEARHGRRGETPRHRVRVSAWVCRKSRAGRQWRRHRDFELLRSLCRPALVTPQQRPRMPMRRANRCAPVQLG